MWLNFQIYMAPNLRGIFTLSQSKHDELWFLLQVNNLNIFPKEMCQKSKMDTTIDFVKHPKHSRINIFLNIFVPKKLE